MILKVNHHSLHSLEVLQCVLLDCVKDMKIHKNKGKRKGLSLTFKQGTNQDYAI
jgi:hypothetical protein